MFGDGAARRSARWALLALTGLLMAGCDSGLGPTGPMAELQRNRARWQATRPDDYVYGVRRSCFCGPDALGPVRVTVSGSDVLTRVYVDSGDPVPTNLEELFPSVEGLFDLIRDALERGAATVDVDYEANTGLPVDIFIDYELNMADEEVGFAVTELPGPPPSP